MPGHMYRAIPHTTETEPETDTETELGNGTFNICDFGLSTRIRSYIRVIFSVCLSLMFVRTCYLLRLSVPILLLHMAFPLPPNRFVHVCQGRCLIKYIIEISQWKFYVITHGNIWKSRKISLSVDPAVKRIQTIQIILVHIYPSSIWWDPLRSYFLYYLLIFYALGQYSGSYMCVRSWYTSMYWVTKKHGNGKNMVVHLKHHTNKTIRYMGILVVPTWTQKYSLEYLGIIIKYIYLCSKNGYKLDKSKKNVCLISQHHILHNTCFFVYSVSILMEKSIKSNA